jgi:hypothetical protein
MTASRERTHVGEWAKLVGDEVPERSRRERILENGRRESDVDEWPDGLS